MESEISGSPEAWTRQILTYLALTLGLVVLIRYLFTSKVPDNIPPFPAKPYPILGHLPYLAENMRKQMDEWRESTGEIYSLYFGPKLVVVLNSYDVLHQAFVKHGDTLSNRAPSKTINDPAEDKGIISTSGPLWKEQRTVAIQILRNFGMGKNLLAEKVSEEVSAYLSELKKSAGEPFEPHMLTLNAVSNIICSIIVGSRFEYDNEYFIKFLSIMNEQFKLFGTNTAASIFPWLRHIPGDFFSVKKRNNNHHQIDNFFCKHYIEKTEKEYDENHLDNFIAAYLHEMKKMERKGKETTLDKPNLSIVLNNLFIAGSETTSTTILWFMVYMLNSPEKQEKVYEEIKDVVGTEKSPGMQDRSKLKYLNAAISETQRLSSIVPMGVPHYCKEDTIVNGYTIPANATVMSNLDAVLCAGDNWKDPLEFRPERFLDAKGNLTQPDQFIPFCIGRRACPGEAMAKMELYLFLSSLIQRFELQPAVPGQPPTREYTSGITSPPAAFKVRFVERS